MAKKSKFLIGAGSILVTVAPIATVISCSGSAALSRYDTENDHTIMIASTWSAGGKQWRALNKIIAQYNALDASKRNGMKVKLTHYEGGYGDISNGLIGKEFKNHVTKNVPNIVIDYPSGAGVINSANMNLDISKASLGANKLDRTIFDPKFMAINDKIGGLKMGGTYAAPLAFSGEMNSLDGPLMHKIFQDIKNNQGTVAFTNNKLKSILADNTAWKADVAYLKQTGDFQTVKDVNAFKGYNVTDATFQSYEGLFELSTKIAQAYKISPERPIGNVIGFDAPANLLYEIAFGLAKNNYSNFIFTKQKYVEWDFAKDKVKKARALKSLQMIEGSIRSGASWIGGGGKYSSSWQVQHSMPMAIGSTAGWAHTYTKDALFTYKSSTFTNELAKAAEKYSNSMKNGKASTGVNVFNVLQADASNKGILANFGTHHNKLYKSDYAQTVGHYDLKLKGGVGQATLDNIKNKIGYISTFDGAQYLKGSMQISDPVGTNKQAAYWVPANTFTLKEAKETIQSNEIVHIPAPMWTLKSDIANVNPYMVKQGPSFVTLHANEAEDNGTAQFIKWFFTTATKVPGEALKPVDYFQKKANYITPIAGWATKTYFNGNKLLADAYKSHTKIGIMEPPVDDYTASFRKKVNASVGGIYSETHTDRMQTKATSEGALAQLITWLKSKSLV